MESKQTHETQQTPSDSGSQKSSDNIVSVCFCAWACLNEWVCESVPTLLNMVGEWDVTWTCLCGGHNESFSSSPDTKERSLAASFSRGYSLPSCVSVEEKMLCCNHFMPGPDRSTSHCWDKSHLLFRSISKLQIGMNINRWRSCITSVQFSVMIGGNFASVREEGRSYTGSQQI